MALYFTPDRWAATRRRLLQAGMTEFEHLRLDLNNPDAGWQPVIDDLDADAARFLSLLCITQKRRLP